MTCRLTTEEEGKNVDGSRKAEIIQNRRQTASDRWWLWRKGESEFFCMTNFKRMDRDFLILTIYLCRTVLLLLVTIFHKQRFHRKWDFLNEMEQFSINWLTCNQNIRRNQSTNRLTVWASFSLTSAVLPAIGKINK